MKTLRTFACANCQRSAQREGPPRKRFKHEFCSRLCSQQFWPKRPRKSIEQRLNAIREAQRTYRARHARPRTCLQCGVVYTRFAHPTTNPKFCSLVCAGAARSLPLDQLRKTTQRHVYAARWLAKLPPLTCAWCATQFQAKRKTQRCARVFCSYECSGLAQRVSPEHRRATAYAASRRWLDKNKRPERRRLMHRLWHARRKYGEYAETYRVWRTLARLLKKMSPDQYQRAKAKGYYETERQAIRCHRR